MRQPEPFFRPKKNRWYVQLDGKHVNLGPDKEQAWAKYHQIMADRASPTAQLRKQAEQGTVFVASVLDSFLDWLEKRVQEGSKAQRTFDWYRKYLLSFLSFLSSQEEGNPEVPSLTVDKLEPLHVYSWVDAQPGWKTGRRGAMTAVQRTFNWAAKAGVLKSIGGNSPIKSLDKPASQRRELLVSEEEYKQVLTLVPDDDFRDLLELSWETGGRPAELFTVEAIHVDLPTSRWVFPIKLSKGKKVQRVVYLSDRALEITRRLMLKRPSGPLLLTLDGTQWCVSSVKCRFQRLCRRLGRGRLRCSDVPPKVPRLKVCERSDPALRAAQHAKVMERRRQIAEMTRLKGVRLNLYAFRHSRITEALVNGIDAVTVSVLAGHADTTMISRHYAHVSQKHEHMKKAANLARGTGA